MLQNWHEFPRGKSFLDREHCAPQPWAVVPALKLEGGLTRFLYYLISRN